MIGKEHVDLSYLFTRKWLLRQDTLLRTGIQFVFVTSTFILRLLARNRFREYILIFYQIILLRLVLSGSHDWDVCRSIRVFSSRKRSNVDDNLIAHSVSVKILLILYRWCTCILRRVRRSAWLFREANLAKIVYVRALAIELSTSLTAKAQSD